MTRPHIYYKYDMNTMKFQNMINTINNHVITVTLGPPYVLISGHILFFYPKISTSTDFFKFVDMYQLLIVFS